MPHALTKKLDHSLKQLRTRPGMKFIILSYNKIPPEWKFLGCIEMSERLRADCPFRGLKFSTMCTNPILGTLEHYGSLQLMG